MCLINLVSKRSIQLAPKAMDTRLEGMEKELEEVKSGLQRLPAIERNMEQLTQGLAQLFQVMEDT